jgi:alkylated DNA nucleotide flippase Atl1
MVFKKKLRRIVYEIATGDVYVDDALIGLPDLQKRIGDIIKEYDERRKPTWKDEE